MLGIDRFVNGLMLSINDKVSEETTKLLLGTKMNYEFLEGTKCKFTITLTCYFKILKGYKSILPFFEGGRGRCPRLRPRSYA